MPKERILEKARSGREEPRIVVDNHPENIEGLAEKLSQLINIGSEPHYPITDANYFSEILLSGKGYKIALLKDSDNEIQGFCLYVRYTTRIYIEELDVHPNFQGKHYGGALVQAALQSELSSDIDKKLPVTLHCRPALEQYYKSLGFKVSAPSNKYCYWISVKGSWFKLPAIPMKVDHLENFLHDMHAAQPYKHASSQSEHQELVSMLIIFARHIKNSTSWWYSGFFHTARKEKALTAIYAELMATSAAGKKSINIENALRAIVADALVVRGANDGNATTTSGRKIVALLNMMVFENLRKIIKQNGDPLQYSDLVDFAEMSVINRRSDSFNGNYPYYHFYKTTATKDTEMVPLSVVTNDTLRPV